MSNAEAIMWAVEKDPALRSDFCNLTILDHRPSDDRIRATIARALDAHPRASASGSSARRCGSCRPSSPTTRRSISKRTSASSPCPHPATSARCSTCAASLAEQPLDRARPLWEFTIIDGLADGRAALLQKVHHTITDGVGGSAALAGDGRLRTDPPTRPRRPSRRRTPLDRADSPRHPVGVAKQAVVDATRRASMRVRTRRSRSAGHVVAHPTEVPGRLPRRRAARRLAAAPGARHRRGAAPTS